MDDLVDLNWLENELKKNKECDISRLLSIDITPAVSDGENYSSVLLRLKLKALSGSLAEKDLHLILKRQLDLTKFENPAVMATLNDAYSKEYNFYVNIFPKLESLLKDNGSHSSKLWPECLASVKGKDIFLEDLQESGYRLGSRINGLDADHCKLVFKSFGTLHAVSCIAISRNIINTEMVTRYPMIDGTTGEKNRKSSAYDFVGEVILNYWEPEWKHIGEKLKSLKDTIRQSVVNVGKVDLSRINVINHGDPWVNNLMFKYGSDGIPCSLKFVDFQMPHYNSFAFDLSYFLNTSVNGELKEKFLNELIDAYCQSFKETLESQDCQLPHPTAELVKNELKRIVPFSLNICVRNRAVMMCKPEDALPLSELVKDNGLTEGKRRLYTNPDLTKVLKIDLPALLADL